MQIDRPKAEVTESKEKVSPSEIRIFAVETTKTQQDHMTKQGFGYSSQLASPQKSTSYIWSGRLYGSSPETTGSQNGRENLEELAQNLADNYRRHQNPALQKAGKPSYSFDFSPTEKMIEENKSSDSRDSKSTVRALNPFEQEWFLQAFQKANADALKKGPQAISDILKK